MSPPLRVIMKRKKLALLCICLSLVQKKRKEVWVKKLLRDRVNYSDAKLRSAIDDCDYQNYLRMNKSSFNLLLNKISPMISKKNTLMRESISAEQRLIATLRFLATGRNYEDLKFSCKISPQLLGKIIPETCKAIYEALHDEYLKFPKSEEEWKRVSDEFYMKWQFPNLLGAMDGKHVRIIKPDNSGSAYYNYKHFFSVVLFAIVNANYEFIYVHVGINGRISDSTVMKHTEFYRLLMNSPNELTLPSPCDLPNSARNAPFVFIGDAAFPLSKVLLKPFPEQSACNEERIFNYRLSRARRVSENAFGIMASRFRFYHQPLQMSVENVDYIVLASCVLHNFLRRRSGHYITESCLIRENVADCCVLQGEYSNDIMVPLQARNPPTFEEGRRVRETFKNYFTNEGKVEFQDKMVNARRS